MDIFALAWGGHVMRKHSRRLAVYSLSRLFVSSMLNNGWGRSSQAPLGPLTCKWNGELYMSAGVWLP